MDFTGKQKSTLKTLAIGRPIMFQIGAQGVTEQVIKNIIDYLRKHEVGRITVLKNCPQTFEEVNAILAENGVFVVGQIGKVLMLYKENRNLKNRIRL
jgi:RNA-binding protein